jgi:minor extracellular serine protease Vpr
MDQEAKLRRILIIIFLLISLARLCGAELPLVLRYLSENEGQVEWESNELICPMIKMEYGLGVEVILRGDFLLSSLPERSERIHRYGELTTLLLPLSSLVELENIAGIEEIYPNTKSEALLDISTSDHMNGSYYGGCSADFVQNFTRGSNVFVGIIDPYPLNWQHEDFGDETGTRIVAIWDQEVAGNPPSGFSYGSEYSKADLDSGIGPAINSGWHHGTQCAGIAAGDGSSSGGARTGMLPEAGIIYVRAASGSVNLINAISYIAAKASGTDSSCPVVISMSVGAMFSHPDGSDPVALALDIFGGTGRSAAVAAGNWYNYNSFASGSAIFGEPVSDLSFTLTGANTPGNDFVISRLYYNPGDDFSVTLYDPSGSSWGSVSPGNDQIFSTPFGKLYVFHEQTSLNNPYIEIVVSDEYGELAAGDTWIIGLEVPAAGYDDEGGFWWGWVAGAGFGAGFDNYYQGAYSLTVYACGSEVLCVAAHDKSNGSLYSASSKGASNGIIKPELTAPTNAYTPNAGSSSSYSSLCCTSGAAPHAAGGLGLLLSTFPELEPADLISKLTVTAFTDGNTGAIPNDRWGYGKLNVQDAWLNSISVGDMNCDGEIDALDCAIVMMYNVGINYFLETEPFPWEDWRMNLADTDSNGVIDAYDASLILQFVVELIDQFPVR